MPFVIHVISLLITKILLNSIYALLKHIKCNNLNFVDGQVKKNASKSWFRRECSKNIALFTNTSNDKLSLTGNCSDKEFGYDNDLNLTDICLVLNTPENLTNLFLSKF